MALSRMSTSIVGRSDSYKYSHWRMYPPGMRFMQSHFEARGGKYRSVIAFGLQYLLTEYFEGIRVTRRDIDRNKARIIKSMGPRVWNDAGWEHLLEAHNGKLPLLIKALPEGTRVGHGVPLLTVENTDERLGWLTNFAETLLLDWYPTTVASQQYAKRLMMLDFLERTGTPADIEYKWQDFGYRGSSSQESAMLAGAAHLLSFSGSDTHPANEFIEEYYGGIGEDGMVSASVPASEHSTVTSWGREREVDAYRNQMEVYPEGPISSVSDSYDFEHACSVIYGSILRDQIIARDGVFIPRPDSGDPEGVVRRGFEILGDKFGYDYNSKGYRVIYPKVRLLQGDGIHYDSAYSLLASVESHRWSVDNFACLGEGGGIHQKCDRDTLKMAIKCNAVDIDGKWFDVFKDPKGDPGKASKRGRLAVIKDPYVGFKAIQENQLFCDNELVPVFKNGEILQTYAWPEIRERALAA